MSWRRAFTILAAVAALGIASDADARTKKKKKKKRSKRAHAAQVHKPPSIKRSNMPDGWSWPPSRAMDDKGKACTDELDLLGVVWKPAPAAQKIAMPITVPAMEVLGGIKFVSTYRKAPHVMDCHLALGLVTYGTQLHGLGVRELHFSRIHDYTQVRAHGVTKNALSRHALGLAIDVRALVDDTGHKAVVVDDYKNGDPLLLRVEDFLNDSGGFRTVLTPRNDPESHYDHFHVEVRVDYSVPATPRPRS